MQLKTSFFNQTLFKKTLMRFWPLWAMASFAGALFPMALLVNVLHGYNNMMKPLEMREMYYNVLVYGVPVISIIYAILCAIAVWGYLYSARSVGMMHTLPMRRDTLFFTNALSGMTMMAIPYVITGALTVLVSLLCGGFDALGTLVTVGGVICDSFFFFGLATLCAMVVGSAAALPVLYALLNFIAVLTDAAVNMLAEGFIFGMTSEYSGQVEWLSPIVYLMSKVDANCVYEETRELGEVGSYAQYYYTSRLTDVTLENGVAIAIYGLVGIALLIGAFLLYRKRRSESAGDVVAFRALKPVFRYGLTFYTAILGGRLLYALFMEAYDTDRYLHMIPMAVCMAVAGAVGYYAAGMILAKTPRVFTKKSLIGLAAVAVGCVALSVSMDLDLFGIGSRVPAVNQIAKLEVTVAGNRYTLDGTRDAELIEAVRGVHKVVIGQQELIKERYDSHEWWDTEDVAFGDLYLHYTLRSGIVVSRAYQMSLSKDRITHDPNSYDYAMDQLVNGTAMRRRRIHADDGAEVTGGWVNRYRGESYDLSSREAQVLLDALKLDAAEGTWGTYDWFDRNVEQSYIFDLELYFTLPNAEPGRRSSDTIYIVAWPKMQHTVAKLLELGFIEESDLITREQYDRENNGYYYYDKDYAYGDAPAMPIPAPAYSADIIGGADAAEVTVAY